MSHTDEIIINDKLEDNLRILRSPQGLSKEQILALVKDTLKKLGYSGEDIAMFSESIAEKLVADSSATAELFSNII